MTLAWERVVRTGDGGVFSRRFLSLPSNQKQSVARSIASRGAAVECALAAAVGIVVSSVASAVCSVRFVIFPHLYGTGQIKSTSHLYTNHIQIFGRDRINFAVFRRASEKIAGQSGTRPTLLHRQTQEPCTVTVKFCRCCLVNKFLLTQFNSSAEYCGLFLSAS